ncbi:DinB family protein [Parafrigoribacterium soli]|uniref:DinB family protein n=1 Tax=Parafrigoribacterium soli TaxID=3144663 RepID=UPI0032EBDFCA
MSEKTTLQHFLDEQRNAVLAIIEGLDEAQLRSAVLPSGWTPIGMIEHLGGAEQHWFQDVALGQLSEEYSWPDEVEDPYDPDAPFATRHSSDAVIAFYRRQCEISNEVLESTSLDTAPVGQHNREWPGEDIDSLRWIALHLIEETARHAGHLDAARELLDGATGLGPR